MCATSTTRRVFGALTFFLNFREIIQGYYLWVEGVINPLTFGTRTVSLNIDSVSYLRVVSEMGSVSGTDPVLSLPNVPGVS